MQGICPVTVRRIEKKAGEVNEKPIVCAKPQVSFYTLLYFLYFLYFTPTSGNIFSTSANVFNEPRFPLAPYMGDMDKKEEKTLKRMHKSLRDVIRRLRWIRELDGLTREDVAKRMGSSVSVIRQIENGKVDPKLSTLRRYALACGGEISFGVNET